MHFSSLDHKGLAVEKEGLVAHRESAATTWSGLGTKRHQQCGKQDMKFFHKTKVL